MIHPAELDEPTLLRDCEIRRTRASGPGGQHRNKVETAIVIEHGPSGVRAEATERRSQEANRKVAVQRLRILLAIAVRTPRTAEQEPSSLWLSRVRSGKVQVSDSHSDFPALLAEALDYASHYEWDIAAAASHLQCTTSQLVKFFQKESAAITVVNRQRTQLGLRTYK